jgi:hypothetical protein
MGFAALNPPQSGRQFVGWVERSETHQSGLRIRGDITESGSARLAFHVMPGEGPVSTSYSAGLANDVDAGPSPGMTASYNRATVEAVIPP